MLPLGHSSLDRNALARDQEGLIASLLKDPSTLIIVTHDSAIATKDSADLTGAPGIGGVPSAVRYFDVQELPKQLTQDRSALWIYVGRVRGQHVIALVVPTSLGHTHFAQWCNSVSWSPLRALAEALDSQSVELAVPVVALANWHVTALYCGRCSAPTMVEQAGWARRCSKCEVQHFPRTDPAVIMAVIDSSDRILLGNSAKWPAGRFSTLAGFVEPGETLDAAVRREVLEESGVIVGQTQFWGSQPWPFPASLMLGYFAFALSMDVEVDHKEITEARWFTRTQLLQELEAGKITLPGKISIARALIDTWLESAAPTFSGA